MPHFSQEVPVQDQAFLVYGLDFAGDVSAFGPKGSRDLGLRGGFGAG